MEFKIKSQMTTIIDDSILYSIYLPIIGQKSISLYLHLHYIAKNDQNIFKNEQLQYQYLLNVLGLNLNELEEAFYCLEAIGLINTYSDLATSIKTYVLLKPLEIDKFIQDDIKKQLLKQAIGENTYHQILYSVYEFKQTDKFHNVSKDIYYLVDKFNLEFIYKFNFEKLKSDLYGFKHFNFLIDNELMKFIENNTNQYNLSYEVILDNILKAIENDKINSHLFKNAINEIIDQQLMFNNYVCNKINRDQDIFLTNKPIDSFNSIINDYKSHKSENYYVSIFNSPIEKELNNAFKTIKSSYNLNDSCLNVLIDFIGFKNGNHFNINYLYKICQTLYTKNYKDVNQIILHLRNSCLKKSSNHQLKTPHVENQTKINPKRTLLLDE